MESKGRFMSLLLLTLPKPNTLTSWEVVLSFVIGKTTANLGADGMAFWYTKQPGTIGKTSLFPPLILLRFCLW